ILKRLRGTPIVRHDAEWKMVYNPHPPYEILQTKLIDFATMQKLRRFARYWDLVGNSGNFIETTPLIWTEVGQTAAPSSWGLAFGASNAGSTTSAAGPSPSAEPSAAKHVEGPSPFSAFMRWSEWLHERVRRTDSIALVHLMELLLEFLTSE